MNKKWATNLKMWIWWIASILSNLVTTYLIIFSVKDQSVNIIHISIVVVINVVSLLGITDYLTYLFTQPCTVCDGVGKESNGEKCVHCHATGIEPDNNKVPIFWGSHW
jgi:hypothetical protein